MSSRPFTRGTIALGLTPIGTTGAAVVARLAEEACAAEAVGFDGVTLSEHHAGFAHYLPSPQVVTAYLLSRLASAWAVPCPAILPLRRPVLVAEDLAWLHAAYPGRVGAGFVAGYQQQDFEVTGADFDSRNKTFWAGLAEVARSLDAAQSAVGADPAIAALRPGDIPLLAGIGGPVGVRRAAECGAGLLVTSLRTPSECAELVQAYAAAGGTHSVVLIRRVHVGTDATGFAASESEWQSRSDSPSWLSAADGALITGSAEDVAKQLADAVRETGCTSLNLRLDAYTGDDSQVARQIELLGREVLPSVRAEFAEQK